MLIPVVTEFWEHVRDLRPYISRNLIGLVFLFILFFTICFGFGYASLNRYDPSSLIFMSDYSAVIPTVKYGLINSIFQIW